MFGSPNFISNNYINPTKLGFLIVLGAIEVNQFVPVRLKEPYLMKIFFSYIYQLHSYIWIRYITTNKKFVNKNLVNKCKMKMLVKTCN